MAYFGVIDDTKLKHCCTEIQLNICFIQKETYL